MLHTVVRSQLSLGEGTWLQTVFLRNMFQCMWGHFVQRGDYHLSKRLWPISLFFVEVFFFFSPFHTPNSVSLFYIKPGRLTDPPKDSGTGYGGPYYGNWVDCLGVERYISHMDPLYMPTVSVYPCVCTNTCSVTQLCLTLCGHGL